MHNDDPHETSSNNNPDVTMFMEHTEDQVQQRDFLLENTFVKSPLQHFEDLTSEYHRSLNRIEVIYIKDQQ